MIALAWRLFRREIRSGELRLLLAETFAHDAFNALACHGGAGNFAGNG